MITELLLSLLYHILNLMFMLIPDFDTGYGDDNIDNDVMTRINYAIDYLHTFVQNLNYFFPVSDALWVITLIIMISNFHLIMYLVNWSMNKIRGAG